MNARRWLTGWSALVIVAVVSTACAGADAEPDSAAQAATSTTIVSTTSTTTTTAAPTTTITTTTTTTSTTVLSGPAARVVVEHNWGTAFATAIDLQIFYPAAKVERIGFHEAGHDGSRQMDPLAEATRPIILESRGRGTDSRTAADIVIDPQSELRSPVTGTVIRAGSYVLYCKYTDDFLVIEPDGYPGWEVKMFHFEGLSVGPGDRVEAGLTIVGSNPAYLPFESQVDALTADPSWPHVHIEVIDTAIPNIPSPGGGC